MEEIKKATKSENSAPAEKFDEGEMTVPQFIKYLTDTYGLTLNKKPFTLNYAHSVIMAGKMPRHYGGNKLRVRKVRGVKTVKILAEKYKFYDRSKDYEVNPGGISELPKE